MRKRYLLVDGGVRCDPISKRHGRVEIRMKAFFFNVVLTTLFEMRHVSSFTATQIQWGHLKKGFSSVLSASANVPPVFTTLQKGGGLQNTTLLLALLLERE